MRAVLLDFKLAMEVDNDGVTNELSDWISLFGLWQCLMLSKLLILVQMSILFSSNSVVPTLLVVFLLLMNETSRNAVLYVFTVVKIRNPFWPLPRWKRFYCQTNFKFARINRMDDL